MAFAAETAIAIDRRPPQVPYISEGKRTVDPLGDFAKKVKEAGSRVVGLRLDTRDKPVISQVGRPPSPDQEYYVAVFSAGDNLNVDIDLGSGVKSGNPQQGHFVPGQMSEAELGAYSAARAKREQLQEKFGQRVDVKSPLAAMSIPDQQLVREQMEEFNSRYRE